MSQPLPGLKNKQEEKEKEDAESSEGQQISPAKAPDDDVDSDESVHMERVRDDSEEEGEGEGEQDLEMARPAARPKVKVSTSFWMGTDWSEEEKGKIRNCRTQIALGFAAPLTYAMTLWAASEKLASDQNKTTTDSDLESSDEGGITAAAMGLVVATGGGLYAIWNGILTWRGLISDHAKKVAAKNDPDLAELDDMIQKLKNLQEKLLQEKEKLPKGGKKD